MIWKKYATVAAFSTIAPASVTTAFQPVVTNTQQRSRTPHNQVVDLVTDLSQHKDPFRMTHQLHHRSTSRLFFSSSNDNDKSPLSKAASRVKSILPNFLQDKKTKETNLAKKKAKDEISTGIDKLLKDAPLGVRMMGKMIAPIIGKVAGTMAEQMKEQSRQMSEMLDDARGYIIQDSVAAQMLGEPIEVGQPFSQSSSSMNINGQTQSNIRAQFEVRGSSGSGVATMDAGNGQIASLLLNVNGRNLDINVSGRPMKTDVSGSGSSKFSSSDGSQSNIGKNRNIDKDDIIDVEFVEKVKK